jgi:hypothetical protein
MSLYDLDSLSKTPSLSTAVLSEVINLSKIGLMAISRVIFEYHLTMPRIGFVLFIEIITKLFCHKLTYFAVNYDTVFFADW